MNRVAVVRLTVSLLAAFVCAVVIYAGASSRPAWANPQATTRIYPGVAPCDTTLQACINASIDGDRIQIAAGAYVTSVTLSRAVSLVGAGAGSTTLNALANQRVLTVTGTTITATTVISGLTIANGSVAANGGGILVQSPAAPLLVNLVISGNQSTTSNGGGLRADAGAAPILVNVSFIGNRAQLSGGGYHMTSGNIHLTGGVFQSNTVTTGSGGAVMLFAGGNLFVTGTQFLSNTSAAGFGGGVYVFGASTATLQSVLFSGNRAAVDGGGVYAEGDFTLGPGSQFISNTATAGSGGGAFVRGSAVISLATFLRNTAHVTNGLGGGLVVSGALRSNLTTWISNTAATGGGALVSHTAAITGDQFMENRSRNDGGGIAVQANADLTGVRFESNRCTFTLCSGAGLYSASAARITSSLFYSNRSDFDGGGAYVSGTATLLYGVFLGNRCTNTCFGGGLYTNGNLVMSGTQFLANQALLAGGGAGASGVATLRGGYFENNRVTLSSSSGGALYLVDRSEITGTVFAGNSAVGDGGAIVHYNGTTRVVNALFADNTASRGAALSLLSFSPAVLLNVTVASPVSAAGSAILVKSGSAAITNTIIASYTTAISVAAGSSAGGDYNLFFGNTTIGVGNVNTGTHSLVGDPRFVNPGARNYHIAPGSAAIDRGTNAGVATDFDGEARPYGAAPDIGADELRYLRVHLPLLLR